MQGFHVADASSMYFDKDIPTPSTKASPTHRVASAATFWFSSNETPKESTAGHTRVPTTHRRANSSFPKYLNNAAHADAVLPVMPNECRWFNTLQTVMSKFRQEWALARVGLDIAKCGHSKFNPEYDAAWNSIHQYFLVVHSMQLSENESLKSLSFALSKAMETGLEEPKNEQEKLVYFILTGNTVGAERLLEASPDILSLMVDEAYIILSFRIFLIARRGSYPALSLKQDATDELRLALGDLESMWKSKTNTDLYDPYVYAIVGEFTKLKAQMKIDWNTWKLEKRPVATLFDQSLSILAVYDICTFAVPFGYSSIFSRIAETELAFLPGHDVYLLLQMMGEVNKMLIDATDGRKTGPQSADTSGSNGRIVTSPVLKTYLLLRDSNMVATGANTPILYNQMKLDCYVECKDFESISFTNHDLSVLLCYYACILAFLTADNQLVLHLSDEFRSVYQTSQDSEGMLVGVDHIGLIPTEPLDSDGYLRFLLGEHVLPSLRCVDLCELLTYLNMTCIAAKDSNVGAGSQLVFSRIRQWINSATISDTMKTVLSLLSSLWTCGYSSDYELAFSLMDSKVAHLPKLYGILAFWASKSGMAGRRFICERSKGYCSCRFNAIEGGLTFDGSTLHEWISDYKAALMEMQIAKCLELIIQDDFIETDQLLVKFDYWCEEYSKLPVTQRLNHELWFQCHVYLGRIKSVRKLFKKYQKLLSDRFKFCFLYMSGMTQECLSLAPALHDLQTFEKLIDIHIFLNQQNRVLELASHLLMRYPHHVKAHFLSADCFLKQGKISLTEKHYYAALAHLGNKDAHERLYVLNPSVVKVVRIFMIQYDSRICFTREDAVSMFTACSVNLAHCEFVNRRVEAAVRRLDALNLSKPTDVIMAAALASYSLIQAEKYEEAEQRILLLMKGADVIPQEFATSIEIYRIYVAWILCAIALDKLHLAVDLALKLTSQFDTYESWYAAALVYARADGMVGEISLMYSKAFLLKAAAAVKSEDTVELSVAELCLVYTEFNKSTHWKVTLENYVDDHYNIVGKRAKSDQPIIPTEIISTGVFHPLCRLYWCGDIGVNITLHLQIWNLVWQISQDSVDNYSDDLLPQLIQMAQKRQKKPGGQALLRLIDAADRYSVIGLKPMSAFMKAVCNKNPSYQQFVTSLIRDVELGDLNNYSACQLLPIKTVFLSNPDLLEFKRSFVIYLVAMHTPKEMVEPVHRKQDDRQVYAPAVPKVPVYRLSKQHVGKLRVFQRESIKFGRMIGSGGFGHVYKATLADGRLVAVKLFRGLSAGAEILKEVKAIAELEHPNLVKLLGVCLNPIATISELCEYGTLHDLIYQKKVQLTQNQKLEVLKKVSSSLCYVHSKRIIHRDIKPSNILISSAAYDPKLCDFGLANQINIDCTHVSLHRDGPAQAGGSPRYMPPEAFRSTSAVNIKVDVWGFACVCIELLAKTPPFKDLMTYSQVMKAVVVEKQRPFPSNLMNSLPIASRLAKLLTKCFEFDAKQRPTMDLLCEELHRVAGT